MSGLVVVVVLFFVFTLGALLSRSFLVMPVQRVPRYLLLLNNLVGVRRVCAGGGAPTRSHRTGQVHAGVARRRESAASRQFVADAAIGGVERVARGTEVSVVDCVCSSSSFVGVVVVDCVRRCRRRLFVVVVVVVVCSSSSPNDSPRRRSVASDASTIMRLERRISGIDTLVASAARAARLAASRQRRSRGFCRASSSWPAIRLRRPTEVEKVRSRRAALLARR